MPARARVRLGVRPPSRQGDQRHPHVPADSSDEGVEREAGSRGGGDRAAIALHELAAPEDPLIPLVRLTPPAESRHRRPAALAPE